MTISKANTSNCTKCEIRHTDGKINSMSSELNQYNENPLAQLKAFTEYLHITQFNKRIKLCWVRKLEMG